MSEVSSTDVVGEKEQISVPKDLYHDFERLKHVTNLNTVDLMRKLLVDYHRTPPEDLLAAMCQPASAAAVGQHQGGGHPDNLVAASPPHSHRLSPKPSSPLNKVSGRFGRKSSIPGQKLNKVCAILHCKHAASKLADKKKSELVSDRSCSSTASSTGSSIDILDDATNVMKRGQPNTRATEALTTSVNAGSLVSSLSCTRPSEFRQDIFSKPDHFQTDQFVDSRVGEPVRARQREDGQVDINEVLDLSVVKCGARRVEIDVVQLDSDEPQTDSDGFLITDISVLQTTDDAAKTPGVLVQAVPTNIIEIQKMENRMYVYPVSSSSQSCSTAIPCIQADGMIQHGAMTMGSLPAGIPPLIPPPVTIPSGVQVMPRAGPKRRSRRHLIRKPPVNEGMKLINENSLYPGVYTSTFKLPGSRRGRRNTSASAAVSPPQSQSMSLQSGNTSLSSANVVMPGLPVQQQSNTEQSYMMIKPQMSVSSVLVKSPRKRGRPPKNPSISQFRNSPDKQVLVNPSVNVSTSSMTLMMQPNASNPISLIYPTQPEQVSSFSPTVQQANVIPQNLPANHSQLMNILNRATSINACNPIFIPNSSFQHGVQPGIAGNGTGLITIPLQQIGQVTGDNNSMVQELQQPVSLPSGAPMLQLQPSAEHCSSVIDVNSVEAGADVASMQPFSAVGDSLEHVKAKSTKSGIFQEMILSPQALVNVKPRSKLTTTELIRSNSNFYCGSFKIRPQKPTPQTGQGAPVKRGRGRPRLNVFESTRQKETKESRSRMYQELFHCKVCNEIFSAGERLSHQRKHVPWKLNCSTCGMEYQSYVPRNAASSNRERAQSQCPHCKEMYDHDLSKTMAEPLPEPRGVDHVADQPLDCSPTNPREDTQAEEEERPEYSEPIECMACQTCGAVCYSSAEYRHHMRSHQERPFTCSEEDCSKLFRNSSELRRHVKHNHNQPKEHLCIYDGCDKKFLKNFHLQEHIRVKHFNIKAFKCSWSGCQKEFAGIRHLKVHMLIHSDEKPLKCEFCDYRCRQRNALNWHMRKHPEVSFKYLHEELGMDIEADEHDLDMDCTEAVGSDSVSGEPSPNGYEPENDDRDSDSSDLSNVDDRQQNEMITMASDNL